VKEGFARAVLFGFAALVSFGLGGAWATGVEERGAGDGRSVAISGSVADAVTGAPG